MKTSIIKRINFEIIPAQIFLFAFWLKNGFIDKVFGVALGALYPNNAAYRGDSWAGWESYITGNWNKSEVAHTLFSPVYNYLFPVIIILQCLPAILMIVAFLKGEFLTGVNTVFTKRAAIASLFVTSVLLFSQTIAGAPDGQYLWQLLGLGMIVMMYIYYQATKNNQLINLPH
ncbi:hypothetical protein L4D04_05725 [Photobacterium angustum]|uniref:Uncharacterized protein n=1 Tax=Photobacterium angustum (strain S14 / CCUG 15956) TaxID=314292 RepID=Q1ZUA6_PHOAS|nr:hypothetical protein VAS14_14344 [Photobacterium angustum S14]